MKITDDLKFDILKTLRSIKHYPYKPYKMPITSLWKEEKCPCRKLEKSEWPEKKVFPWHPPKFFDA